MKPPTFSAEVSRSRHSRTDLLWRESVGVCRECGGDRGQGNVATNTNETTSRTGVIGITCELSIRCQCHKHQYTGGQKENFFAKCHLSSFFSRSLTFRPCEALPASSLGCLLQSKHFLSIMFKQTQNVSSSVYSSPPLLPSSSPTEL